jgi:hypothetical protein
MSYETTSADYCPKNTYSNPAEQQMRFHPDHHVKQMAQGQERIYAGAILGAEAKQRQQGNVTREIQQLEKNLHVLASVIDALDNRLAAACLPIPETASGLRTSDGGGCALANQLSAFNSMLSVQVNRIEMLYQGVDL